MLKAGKRKEKDVAGMFINISLSMREVILKNSDRIFEKNERLFIPLNVNDEMLEKYCVAYKRMY